MKPHWHTYHEGESPLFFSDQSRKDRLHTINTEKPEHERETRLRLFQPVKGKLPEEVDKAGRDRNQAQAVYSEANARCIENRGGCICEDEGDAFKRAKGVFKQSVRDNNEAILALHAKECPDCPWTPENQTIFSDPAGATT